MKIVIINSGYPPDADAGPAFSVQQLAEQFVVDGHQATIICISKDDETTVQQVNGVNIHRLGRSLDFGPQNELISDIIKSSGPDVVHTNWLRGFQLSKLADTVKESGARLVHTVREYRFVCKSGTLFRVDNGPCKSICQECRIPNEELAAFAARVDTLVGVSQFCLDLHLRAGVFPNLEQSRVIRNSFKGPAKQPQMPKYEAGEKIKLGYIGRLQPTKGVQWFLKQLAESDLIDKVHFSIAGSVPNGLDQEVKKRYPRLHVEWHGFLGPSELFERIDWLIVPSIWYEPSSRAVLESFSFGVPVLGSTFGGIPEIVVHAKNGRLFSPQNEGGVINQLKWIADNPGHWADYRSEAWQSRLSFAPKKIAGQYIDAYNV